MPPGVAPGGTNRHDGMMLADTLDAVPPMRSGRQGRPRHRPDRLRAGKGCDYRRCRRGCRARSIRSRIARRGIESSQKPGRHRWVVERSFAWLNQLRRMALRHERRADPHLALTILARVVTCLRQIKRFFP